MAPHPQPPCRGWAVFLFFFFSLFSPLFSFKLFHITPGFEVQRKATLSVPFFFKPPLSEQIFSFSAVLLEIDIKQKESLLF